MQAARRLSAVESGDGTTRCTKAVHSANQFRTQSRAAVVDPASYDFRLVADSPLIDAGIDPGKAGDSSLWPQFEYVHPASGRKRQRVGKVDLGAYEFCGW